MFEKVLASARELFSSPPSKVVHIRNIIVPVFAEDTELFASILAEHPVSSEGQLGTIGQAQELIAEIRSRVRPAGKHDYNPKLSPQLQQMAVSLFAHKAQHELESLGCGCGRRWSPSQSRGAVIGSRGEVSRLLEPRHTIGFEVYSGQDDWTVEYLEVLDHFLRVIRHGKQFIRFQHGTIDRTEQCGSLKFG